MTGIPRNLGLILLSIWLILMGMAQALELSFRWFGIIMGVLAIVAGVLLLLGR